MTADHQASYAVTAGSRLPVELDLEILGIFPWVRKLAPMGQGDHFGNGPAVIVPDSGACQGWLQ